MLSQEVLGRAGEVRERGLEKHIQELGGDADADSGRKSRAEVLPAAEHGGQEGAPPDQYP